MSERRQLSIHVHFYDEGKTEASLVRFYPGGQSVYLGKGAARCHPDDKFSLQTGTTLAVARMFEDAADCLGKENRKYDIVLIEKEGESGLTWSDTVNLIGMLSEKEWFPIEIMAKEQECSAMGFIGRKAAEKLEYDYDSSGLDDYVAEILDDLGLENDAHEYEFNGLKIWMGY